MYVEVPDLHFKSLKESVKKNSFKVTQNKLLNSGWILVNDKVQNLIEKLKSENTPLKEYVQRKIYYGIKTGLNEAFVIDETTKDKLIEEDPKNSEIIKPFLLGKEIKRYQTLSPKNHLIFFPRGFTNIKRDGQPALEWFKNTYPKVYDYLRRHEQKAKNRYDKGDYWWELRACDYYSEFEKPKIIYPNICKKPEFAFDDNNFYTNQKCFIISKDDKFLLGILNSQLMNFLFTNLLPKLRGNFFEPSYIYFKNFPIARTENEKLKTDLSL